MEALRSFLESEGHEVIIFAPYYPGHRDAAGVVHRFPSVTLPAKMRFPLPLPIAPGMYRRIAALGIDLFHTHHPFAMGAAALRIARRLRRPLVTTIHTQYEQYLHYIPLPGSLLRPTVRWSVARYCNTCQAVTTPAAIAAAVIDYWGVYHGTTRAVIEQHSEWVPKLSVHVPVPTSPGLPDLSLGIGLGDFVFLTLFLASARRFGLRERRTFWLSFLFLVSAMAVVLLFDRNVPALVPMSAAFLLANVGRFRFQQSELRAMLYAAVIVAVVVGLVLVFRYG